VSGAPVAIVAAAALALHGCAPIPSTQVIVYLSADAELRARATRLEVSIVSQEGVEILARDKPLTGDEPQLARIPVVPRDGDASRFFVVRARLFDPADAVLGALEATLRFRPDELAEARFVLDEACAGATDCGDGRTCVSGSCVGGCFEATGLEPIERARPLCSACERCVGGGCEPLPDGTACGCPGESCVSGTCRVGRRMATLIAGESHTCAETEDQHVYCWGANDLGQLGQGDVGPALSASPVEVAFENDSWVDVLAGGGTSTCILLGSNAWICWGGNEWGQFGTGGIGVEDTPLRVTGPELVAWSGANHFCGVDRGGSLHCAGYNAWGQLGRGSPANEEPTIERAGDDSDWTSVEAEGLHSCAIRRDGSLWCWGYNDSGELGVGDTINRPMPERVGCAPGQDTCWDDWTRVANGYYHTCALRADGSLWCWGGGASGQLGLGGTTRDEVEPRHVEPGSRWSLVESGTTGTCAIRDDGSLWCWGPGIDGQNGDGTRERRAVPSEVVAPAAGDRWDTVDVGAAHACGIRNDRSLWCWGANGEGELGTGATSDQGSATPLRVCIPAAR
jgi:alpha-tubulin suppressor-like RCC1 family protein